MAPSFEVLYYPDFEPSELWLRRYLLVYDKVWSVIPKDAQHELSIATKEHADAIPNSFGTLSPMDRDKSLGKVSLDRLDKVFEQIQNGKTRAGKKNEIVLTMNTRNFDIEVSGSYSFLHYDKFNRQVYELLKKHKLFSQDASKLYQSIGGSEEFLAVDPSAANIIMSNLADNIARRKGLNTITDQNIAFMVTSLNSLDGPLLHVDSRDWLISSVVKFEIPSDIQSVRLKEYKILRESYADMRYAFHDAVANLTNVYRLDRIDDLELLRDKVKNVLADLDKEVRSYKKTRLGKKILQWTPFSIGNLFALTGMVGGLIGNKLVSATGTGASIACRLIDRALSVKEVDGRKEKLVRMLAGIQKDIIKNADVRKLI